MIVVAAPAVTERRVTTLLGAASIAVVLTAVASRNGGYFPTSFGWTALLFAWCALVLVLVGDVYVSASEMALLSSLAAFAVWTWVSALWSRSIPATLLEGERALVYLTAVAALAVAARRIGVVAIVAGVLSAITVVCAYSLLTRVFPDRFGTFDPISTYRLSTPVGYWNGLGLFAAMGSLLALGVVARSRVALTRALAAAALVILVPTIYFTFSRGAWLALTIALVALVAVDPRRLQLCVALLVAAPAPAIAVVLASHSSALTTLGAKLDVASRQGHRLAVELVVLAVVAGLLALSYDALERRVVVGRGTQRGFAGVLAAVVVAACIAVVAEWGSPWHIASRSWHAFVSAPPVTGANLNGRLFHFSNHGRIVSWKSAYHEFESAPVGGTGSGTFETWWLSHRPGRQQIRDAHSLYIETMGELGIVGLVLLVVALLIPLAGAVRNRHEQFVPFAGAALLAWAVHAGVDWDWEIPAVTLAALACAVVCVGGPGWRVGAAGRTVLAAAAVAVAGFALVAAIGNQALSSSQEALDARNYAKADAEARRAARWAPWASEPWIIRGQIDALNQDPQAARASFRKAIDRDPRNYLAWYGLAGVERGAARRQAAAEVQRLNPFSTEAAELRP